MNLSTKGLKLAVAALLLLGLVCWSNAYAGGGKYENGRFNLLVSIRHDANPDTLNLWKNAFQQASELLYDATDGQHQFGTIFLCNKGLAGRSADIHLFEQDGRSYVNLPIPGLGRTEGHMFLYGDEKWKPFVIVHEFGHYGYGLYDEYSGPFGDAECVENPSNANASIMEGGWWQAPVAYGGLGEREISEFCVPSNHDPDGDTEQQHRHGKSCWETMVDYYPDLIMPTCLPNEGPTCGADPIVWIELEPETRLVLCLDRSGSMDSPPWKMEYAKLGAQLFVDLTEEGDKIGVVSFGSDVCADFPLTEVLGDETKDAAKGAIEGIFADGPTPMGDGLREALNQIISPGDTACQQAIVLLSNGYENAGTEDPLCVTPDIKGEMVRVFTVGIGDDVDEELLQTIASETNGQYFRIREPWDLPAIFSLLSMEVKDGGLILKEDSLIAQGEAIQRWVRMSDTDDGAAFELTWEGSDLDLILYRPDGSKVNPSDPGIEFVSTPNYEFYRVASPDTGVWELLIEGVEVLGQTAFTAQVLSENRTISFDVYTDKDQYQYPEETLVQAEVLFGVPVTGVIVEGIVIRPDGSGVPIELFDDGLSIHGDEFADDGRYSNFFSSYNEDGAYTFELVVENRGDGAIVNGGERLHPDDVIPPVTVPLFKRWASATTLVSEVPAVLEGAICGDVTLDNGNPVANVTVKVIDADNNQVGAPFVTGSDGNFYFDPLIVGTYSIMIVTPLGYSVWPAETQTGIEVIGYPCTEAHFVLTPTVTSNDCRSIGYWKHQFDVYLSGRGNAQESSTDLEDYLDLVHLHFDVLGVYVDLENFNFEDAKDVLTVKGSGSTEDHAKQQLFALLLNFASGKIGNETVVSEDGRLAAEAVSYAANLINDGDPTNDGLAQTVCVLINKGQMIGANTIPESPERYKFNTSVGIPDEYSLHQNYPNPFNPRATIRYALPEDTHVKLVIYNVAGQKIKILVNEEKEAGYHESMWNGDDVAGGIYFCRLQAGDFVQTRKMILLK
jgi:uncharacterized protein YegL